MTKVSMEATIDINVTENKTGKILESRRLAMESFVDFFAAVVAMMFTNTIANSQDTGGVSRASVLFINQNGWNPAASGEVTKGIILGTGNTPVDHTDNNIETLIAHGTGSGQVQYGALIPSAVTWSAPSSKWTWNISRIMSNISGASITVKEVGIYFREGTPYSFMPVHDVLAVPVALPDGASMEVTYSFSLTA